MPSLFGDSPALLALIALLPAVISWWSGRKLLALVDDPILPERMNANQRRTSLSFIVALAGLAALGPSSLFWTGPLAFLSAHAASFPVRRAIFGETWSLGAYLSFFSRMMFGLFGFWVVLMGTPAFTRLAGSADWIAGGVLAAVLLLWNAHYPDVVRYFMRATPLEEGELLSRFRELAGKSALPQPRFETVRLGGGVVANALALPSLKRSSVLFTDTLLARLERDEAAAICAHELAHLEYYDAKRLGRLNSVTSAVIVAGCLWTPAVRALGLAGSWLPILAWFLLLTAVLTMRARGKQQQETVCDTRAVALTGSAEPLIAALTKLYTIARIPRRIELRYEQADSHPSLARRIKDIRKAAGAAPAAIASTEVFVSADGRTTVTFDQRKLHWTGADAITHSVDYGNLSELRIDATRGAHLVARGARAGAWEMPLGVGDIVRAQALLDQIDGRLGESITAAVTATPLKFARQIVGVLTVLALMFGQLALAIVALFACIRLTAPLLVAAGIGALTAAALTLREAQVEMAVMMTAPAALVGIVLLGLAWRMRVEPRPRIAGFLAVIAALALVSLASIGFSGLDAVRLHQSVRATPSAIVLLAALAGAMACSPFRASQALALATTLVGAITSLVGSPWFLDRFGRDPFLIEGPAIEWIAVNEQVLEEFAVPSTTSRIRLSPDGHRIAALAQSYAKPDDGAFHIGRAGEELVPLAADDLIFLDNEHVLLAESDFGGTTLRKIQLDSSREAVWTQRVDGMIGSALTFDRDSQRWRLIGWDRNRGMFRAEGIVGESKIDELRWAVDDTNEPSISAFTTVGSDALVVEARYDIGLLKELISPQWSWMMLLMQPPDQESHYWRVSASGRTKLGESRFGADCYVGVLASDAFVCSVYDGTRTRFISLDASGNVGGLGWLPGRFVSDRNAAPDWIMGWAETTPVAIRVSARQALTLGRHAGVVGHLAVAGDRLAAVTYGRNGPTVRTYAVDRVTGWEAMR